VRDAISGYAPALDLTLRDVQAKLKEKGLPWELAKSFDGAYVLAPFVAADAVEDVTDIGIRLSVDGQLRQDGNSRDMLNPIIPLIQHIAAHFSLQAGDVVSTGTPAGVGPLHSGEQLHIELPGLSGFTCRVR
jgi:2-keto-4-pentenoate hydratase/2-oxohepta-3-ene-1,7-dioic acid hydratase in catechol pathway